MIIMKNTKNKCIVKIKKDRVYKKMRKNAQSWDSMHNNQSKVWK